MAQRLSRFGVQLTSVDRGNLDDVENLLGLPVNRFTIIPNGMLASETKGLPFTTGARALTVAHVGSLTEDKGWRIAAEAVISEARAGRKIRLLIAGSGPQEPQAKQMADQHPDCVTFLGHVADPCRTLLPSVDVFVLMTSNDGLPMAIIEAMSCGIPVVSTRIGGIPNAVAHAESGFLVERSAEALAEVLDSVYRQPARLAILSEGTRRIFKQRFDIELILRAYDVVYQNTFSSRQSAAAGRT